MLLWQQWVRWVARRQAVQGQQQQVVVVAVDLVGCPAADGAHFGSTESGGSTAGAGRDARPAAAVPAATPSPPSQTSAPYTPPPGHPW